MKKALRFAVAVAIALAAGAPEAHAALKVVTSTEDLAAIVREIGGDKVEVEALARGYQDPHFVEAKPSFILKSKERFHLLSPLAYRITKTSNFAS